MPPLAIYHFISSSISLNESVSLYVKGVLFVGENYNSWPLWYLLSTMYALLLISAALKTKNPKWCLRLMCVLASVLSIEISNLVAYGEAMPKALVIIKALIRNSIVNGRILTGMIYIPIGMLLVNRKISIRKSLLYLILGYLMNFFVDNVTVCSYILILRSVAFFCVILEIRLKKSENYLKLRNMSTTIYLTHMYIWTFYYKIVYGGKTYGVDSFLVTSIVATSGALLLEQVRTRRKEASKASL